MVATTPDIAGAILMLWLGVTSDWASISRGAPSCAFQHLHNDLDAGLEGILSKFANNTKLGGAFDFLEIWEALQRGNWGIEQSPITWIQQRVPDSARSWSKSTSLWWLVHAKALWAGSSFTVTKGAPSAHTMAFCSLFRRKFLKTKIWNKPSFPSSPKPPS